MAARFLRSLSPNKSSRAAIVNCRTERPLALAVEAAVDSASRRRGLLGRASLPAGHAMVIAPTSAIHTFFMQFTIDVVFATGDGRVVGVWRGLRPWRIAVAPRAACAIELPPGAIDASGTRVGDQLVVELPAP